MFVNEKCLLYLKQAFFCAFEKTKYHQPDGTLASKLALLRFHLVCSLRCFKELADKNNRSNGCFCLAFVLRRGRVRQKPDLLTILIKHFEIFLVYVC